MGNENESGKIGVGCQVWPKDTVNPSTNLAMRQTVGISCNVQFQILNFRSLDLDFPWARVL